MLNRVINRVRMLFIVICAIIALCFGTGLMANTMADNSQFHKKEYQDYSKQQKPIYEFDSYEKIHHFIGLDLREATVVKTKNYIYMLNFKNNHTLIVSRTDNVMFAGVNIYCAYMITGNDDAEVWQLYIVERTAKDSDITKRFYKMEAEWKECMSGGCPSDREEPNNLKGFEEGMMVF